MIVKNERKTLPRLFKSLKNIINTYVIVDTGSTDGTQEYIRQAMDSFGIRGEVHERSWINFGENRQMALELGVGTADYLMIIDADEELITPAPNYYKTLHSGCYNITRKYSNVEYDLPFLIRVTNNNELGWKWNAPVHNYLTSNIPVKKTYISNDISHILSHPHQGAKSQNISTKEKYLKDASLLEAELIKIPNDKRSMFYLAQSYKDAKEYEKAIQHYLKRTEMGGWIEEVFYSYLQLGLIFLQVKDDVETAENYFLTAAKTNPKRYAEIAYPLVRYHRSRKNYPDAVFWGCSALPSLTFKNKEKPLFYQKDIYAWRLKDELSLALYYFEAKVFAKKLMQELLLEVPNGQKNRIENNLKFFN